MRASTPPYMGHTSKDRFKSHAWQYQVIFGPMEGLLYWQLVNEILQSTLRLAIIFTLVTLISNDNPSSLLYVYLGIRNLHMSTLFLKLHQFLILRNNSNFIQPQIYKDMYKKRISA